MTAILHTDEQTGLTLSAYTGPQRTDGHSPRRYRLTLPGLDGQADGRQLDMSVLEWIALIETAEMWKAEQ